MAAETRFWEHDFATCVTCDAAGALVDRDERPPSEPGWNAGKAYHVGRRRRVATAHGDSRCSSVQLAICGSARPHLRIFSTCVTAKSSISIFRKGMGRCAAFSRIAREGYLVWTDGQGRALFASRVTRCFPLHCRTRTTRCTRLYGADDGAVWAACYAMGMGMRVKDGRLTMITAAQGLYDDHISQIVPDHGGWLWLGTLIMACFG